MNIFPVSMSVFSNYSALLLNTVMEKINSLYFILDDWDDANRSLQIISAKPHK